MKKRLTQTLIVLFSLALAVACSKKDDAQPSLVGTWKFTSYAATNCTNSSDNGTDTCTSSTASDCGILTLTSTTWAYAQTISGAPPVAENGTYSLSGSSITLSGGTNITGSYTYSISGNTLTLSQTNSSNGCKETITFTRM